MSPVSMPRRGLPVNDLLIDDPVEDEVDRFRDLLQIEKEEKRDLQLVLHESDDEVIRAYVLKATPEKIEALRALIDANRCACNRVKPVNERYCIWRCSYCGEHRDFICDNPSCLEEQYLEWRTDMAMDGEDR